MAEVVRRRFRVSGHVQGVFFRASTAEVARREGVTGWAQNQPDGTVLAEVQGDPRAVQAVQDFLHEGPARARVTDVGAEDIDPVHGETGFDTR